MYNMEIENNRKSKLPQVAQVGSWFEKLFEIGEKIRRIKQAAHSETFQFRTVLYHLLTIKEFYERLNFV